jgi:hypothetical protein
MSFDPRFFSFAAPLTLALALGSGAVLAQPAAPPASAPQPAGSDASPAPLPPPPAPLLPSPPPSAAEPATLTPPPPAKARALAPEAPFILEPAAGQAGCAPRSVRAAVAQLRASLVRVRAPGGVGLGIILAPSGRVLTAFSLVEAGRGIEIQLPGEESRRDAHVVAVHQAGRVALLELEPADDVASGVQLAPEDILLGEPVIALGATWEGEQSPGPQQLVVSQGAVTATEAGVLRSSVLESRHMLRGSPIVDCSGRLVGVATDRWDDVAATAAVVRELLAPASAAEDYSGGWSLAHPSLSLIAQFGQTASPGYDESDRWLGGSLGLALIGDDQWFFPLRLSLLGLTEPDPVGQLADRSGMRFQAHLGIGYRAMVRGGDVPFYIVPEVGGLLSWERIREEGTLLQADLTSCAAPGLCPVSWEPTVDERELFRAMPTVGLSLQIGVGQFGYEAQLDPKDMERTVHQVLGGVQF